MGSDPFSHAGRTTGSDPLVCVLAGGASRRMRAPKPLADLGGRPLISYPLAAAAAAGLSAVVVAKADTPLPRLDVPIWTEPDEPRHPLLGLVTALERAGGPVVAVACDQPWLAPELLARLAAGTGPIALCVEGRLEPLPARCEPAALPSLRASLADRTPLRAAIERLAPAFLEQPAETIESVNTPEALAAAQRRMTSLRPS